MSSVFTHKVQIYYEDTDHSGVVYHANYLKYFERAREHIIDGAVLAAVWRDRGVGFVVYKASLTYADGVQFGEVCEVRTTVRQDGNFRTIWEHEFWRPAGAKAAVTAQVELVCVDQAKDIVPTPQEFLACIG
ncbi:acyl-CoA thioesterase [Mangrovimicrobium sediminis]|uniref:Acyl-CoA thioesterase n=1 Tax=Mangrovimicrobium sediminis TaxID=2562682 RepID=A0A4Z0LYX0_9GAMM|nr:thioesterase family protein [Haliea sp. SAOS-164]TGD72318.1 acyl-CoA thioesterase [Haliea sp. SAOS-164]